MATREEMVEVRFRRPIGDVPKNHQQIGLPPLNGNHHRLDFGEYTGIPAI
jgi:hypothetical protein